MNTALLRITEEATVAMINVNPRGYLSTQLERFQENLSVYYEVDVSLCTISRCLHNLAEQGIINLLVVPIRGKDGQWHGRKLIIKATKKLHGIATRVYHSIRNIKHLTERARMLFQPTLTKSKVLKNPRSSQTIYYQTHHPGIREYPTFKDKDLPEAQNLKPFWQDSASLKGYLAFKEALHDL